jgi:cell division protease FtsH
MKRAEKILTDNLDTLHRLAEALLEREILDASEIDAVIRGEELPPVDGGGDGQPEDPPAGKKKGTAQPAASPDKPPPKA